MTRFQKLAVATAAVTVLLFAVGGLVRGTGSGLGCSTWPACEPGRLFPTGTIHSLIEFSHRALAGAVLVLTALTGLLAWRDHRGSRKILWPALAAFPLVLVQAGLGGIVVVTDLHAGWVTVHFVTALVLIADVVVAAVNGFCVVRLPAKGAEAQRADLGFARLALATAAVTGLLLLVGTYVRAQGSGLAFTDWPLMNGRLVPLLDGDTAPMFAHRVLAFGSFLLVAWTAIRARAMRPRARDLVIFTTVGLTLFVVQIAVGALNVFTRLRPWAVVAHIALSVLIWGTLVALAAVSRRFAVHARDLDVLPTETERGSLRERIGAYVALTKPRIVVLLLITTVPAMILAERRVPPIWLILATVVGGAVAAASANSINMYLDRDIDEVMARTRRRPIPRHSIEPQQALGFGFLLGAVSFVFLATTVNVLAATLALAAIAFYVFVYTMWLKRSTTQNIVIGGAAGAAPALVGWAAVTGTLAAPAWLLFAIVFVWTPPHFWALAMRYRGDYAAAGIPMLPVVRGDVETRRQILLYALVLFAVTLVLAPVAGLGPVYLAVALVLGGTFVYRALALWRWPSPERSWAVFRFSIVYLAALFGGIAVDALLG
jgi:protoheme IX farnesyltransferase